VPGRAGESVSVSFKAATFNEWERRFYSKGFGSGHARCGFKKRILGEKLAARAGKGSKDPDRKTGRDNITSTDRYYRSETFLMSLFENSWS
jgi:hypothetical protein